jgi:DNA-binding SARP family transcriptional activator
MTSMGALVRVELLGTATLRVGEQAHVLERKTAGVLAYLALEGQQSRSHVAALLWADSGEDRARANLRQCLHRLKNLSALVQGQQQPWLVQGQQQPWLVQGEQQLSLFGAQIDVLHLEQQALLRDYEPWTHTKGELLSGHFYDDCPEFEDWLYQTRQRLATEQRSAFRGLLGQQPKAAHLEIAQRWLGQMPLQTDALKAVVEAQLGLGQSSEAKLSIEAFNTRHERELGVGLPHLFSWLESGASPNAQALLEQAADAVKTMQKAEATALYLQAADLFAQQKNTNAECDALLEALDLLAEFDWSERFDAVLERVAAAAHTPLQTLRWRMGLQQQSYLRGQWAGCIRHAKKAASLAARLQEFKHELDCLGYVAASQIELGQREESETTFALIVERAKASGDPEAICVSLNNLSFARDVPGRNLEVIALLQEALEVAEAAGLVDHQLTYLNQLAFTLYRSDNAEATHDINRALALHQRISGEAHQRARTYKFLGDIEAGQANYQAALEALEQGLRISAEGKLKTAHLQHTRAKTLTFLGAFEEAQAALEVGLAERQVQRVTLMVLRYAQAQLWRYQGIGSLEKVKGLQNGLEAVHLEEFNNSHFEYTLYLPTEERVAAVQAMLRPDVPYDAHYLALAYLANQQAALALPITQALYARLETHRPKLYPPEIMLCHADVLQALGQEAAAAEVLATTRAWVQEKADWLPPERRAAFWQHNPFNRRLLGDGLA